MFALKPRTEIAARALLIAVIVFNAFVPTAAAASSLSGGKANGDLITTSSTENISMHLGEMAGHFPGASQQPRTSTSTGTAKSPNQADTLNLAAANAPILSLTADPDYLTANSQLVLNWTVDGISLSDYQLLLLQITVPDGLSLQAGYQGTYDEATRVLTITVTALSGQVGLITGATVQDARLKAVLVGDNRTLAGEKFFLPVHEEFVVGQQGGEIIAAGGKIKIMIPADTFKADAIIDVGEPSSQMMPVSLLAGQPFEINAKDKKDKTKLHQFTKKIQIEVNYADLNIPEEKTGNLFLYWYNPETQDWAALPSSPNAQAIALKGQTDHLSVFAVGLNQWQAARMPTVDDFQVAQFTGAATFSLPIEVPAGPGGFQPSLTLSYNSQVVDQSTTETQAAWVGMGWSLETGSIEVDTANTVGLLDDTYFINVGGISARLIPDTTIAGLYHAADENFWKFYYDSTNKVWTVSDKVGNIYYFEEKLNLYYGLDCDPDGSPNGGVVGQMYQWMLTRVKNIYGKELQYAYERETKPIPYEEYSTGAQRCNSYSKLSDTAIFPKTILYPNGRYRIYFQRENRADYTASWVSDAAHHNFERTRLQNIYVQHDPGGTGFVDPTLNASQTVRRYSFTYESDPSKVIYKGITYSAGGRVSTLSRVEEFDVGGATSLPANTFTYGDNLHLTQATNGYGGSVVFDYDDQPSQTLLQPWHYDPTTTEDRITSQDFEGCTDYTWSARDVNSSIQLACSGPDDFLSVSGSAIHTDLGLHWLRPGGVYRVSSYREASVASAYIGIFDGQNDHYSAVATAAGPMSYTFTLPSEASVVQRTILTSGGALGPYTNFRFFKLELLPSFYRVKQKRVSDGNNHTYTYSYDYTNASGDTAAVNDSAHSSVCALGQLNCTDLVNPYTEFRGHAQVTETGPDGRQTVTTFYQGDARKGQPITVTVKNAAGTKLTETIYTSNYLFLPRYAYPGYTLLGFDHYWVHPTLTENRVYASDGSYTGTIIKYTYDESSSTNYSYGNLITREDQSLAGVTYRKTTNYYFPNATSNLVSLPAKTKVFDAAGNTLGITIYLYDNNVGDHQIAPSIGKLTAVRTLIQNANDYSQVSYAYDAWGNRTTETTYNSYGTWDSSPAANARTTYICFGGGGTLGGTACADDGVHTYPLWSKNPLNQTTTLTYDYNLGVPLTETDPNGNPTAAQYDIFGRMTRLIRPGDDSTNPTMRITYNDTVQPFRIDLEQRMQDSTYQVFRKYYDGMGRLLQDRVWNAEVNGQNLLIVVNFAYDAHGRVTKQTAPFTLPIGTVYSEDFSHPYTSTTYDSLGRPVTINPPNGNGISYSYDGLVSTATDAKGNTTTTTTDVWGRASSVVVPTGPGVTYAYDELDRLKSVIRGGVTTAIKYDQAGRKIGMDDPDMGIAGTLQDDNWAWTYAYDALGNLTRQKDAKGQRICLYYDALNRLTGKHYRTDDNCPASPALNVTYTYDVGTNAKGQRTSMTDASGSTSWNYDARGRMTKETKTITANPAFITEWNYNSADQMQWMKYPDGEELTYGYKSDGTLDTVTSNLIDPSTGLAQIYLADTQYDEARRITSMDYGASVIRKAFNYYAWNTATNGGLLNTAITTRLTDNITLQSFEYGYDENANIQTIIDYQAGSQTQTFGYDALNRLTSAAVTGGSTGLYNESYAYNVTTGNLASKAGLNYTYDVNHAHAVASLSNGNTYQYDLNGNMTQRNVGALIFDLAYDEENRLVSVTANGVPPTSTPPPTVTPSQTATSTVTPSQTATATKTNTPSLTPTKTNTPSGPTSTSTLTPTATLTPSGPTTTFTSTPSPTNTAVASSTATQSSNSAVYLSLSSGDTVGGVAADDLDILYFDGANWSMFFDASDVGITEGTGDQDLNDFQIVDADTILLTFDNALTIGTLSVDPNDIVQFNATSLGDITAGTFSLYFDGSDVGLDDTVNEVVDALDILSDGRLLISTIGDFSVPGLTGKDEDLLAFTPTALGDTTSGTWAMYFDGSLTALGLGQTAEDIDALEIAANGNIYLSAADVFSVTGISGDDEDIFICTPAYTSGAVTSCTYSSTLFFDGSVYGLSANDVDAINLPLGLAFNHSPLAKNPPLPRGEGSGVRAHFASYNFAPPQQSGSVTFTPTADAYVAGDTTTTNYGTATTLRADNSPDLNSYLRFDVQGLTGSVISATLRIYANSASSTGYDVYGVADNTWTETGINYSNAPAMGSQLGSSGTFSAGVWTSVDVTSYITSNGVYNLAFSTTSNTNISFASREAGANAPQLVIQTASGPTNTPTATATPSQTLTPTRTATPIASNTPTATPAPPFSNATFVYDGDGKRVKSTINGSLITYFVGAHYEVANGVVTKYYYAGSQRIAMRTNGTLNYLLGDHLGSTSLTTSATGTVVSELRYKAWGEVSYASGNTPTKYTYTGQYSYTGDFGLMFYNARWYDPYLNHFTQPDTILPNPYNPQSYDRYSYALNNPLKYTDPTGHKVTCDVDENCKQSQRLSRFTGTQFWKALIKDDFGITMSDSGGKAWDLRNLGLVYSSLQNISRVLDGQLKSLVGGSTFQLGNYKATKECPKCTYGGLTSGTTITFNTLGNAAIRQMNIYHEFGHLLDNSPGMENRFTDALKNLEHPSFIRDDGFLDPSALINSGYLNDPNYGPHVEALQHPYSSLKDLKIGTEEHWADIFANYVAGNINSKNVLGADMITFITGVLP
jgi:RHS repeat-associated protein